jgi:uncharacterized membrane protein YphA (DoxX/SURF4 family)
MNRDVILLAGRVALGVIFVRSGLQKLLALSAFGASLASRRIGGFLLLLAAGAGRFALDAMLGGRRKPA